VDENPQPQISLKAALALTGCFCAGMGLIHLGFVAENGFVGFLGVLAIVCTIGAFAAVLSGRSKAAWQMLLLFGITTVCIVAVMACSLIVAKYR